MTKILIIAALFGTVLFANMATNAVKHEVKKETHHQTKDVIHHNNKNDLNVNKKIKKEKRKMKVKAVKAVL